MRTVSTTRAPTGAEGSRRHALALTDAAPLSRSIRTRSVEIEGRGRVFVKQFRGPVGAPNLVLLHGWTATADLNWQTSYESLSEHFNVVAFDHHGHGRGVRSAQPFRLEDCADDVAAVTAALGMEQVIVAGYSMGGPIASLVWRRHPHLVDGLVMCATSQRFSDSATRRAFFSVMGGTAQLSGLRQLRALGRIPANAWSRRLHRRGFDAGVIEQGLAHDWTRVLEAGVAIGRFDSRAWSHTIDVPTAVVATLDDVVVPTPDQLSLVDAIRGATLHQVPGGHTACTFADGPFTAAVVAACQSVAGRAPGAQPTGGFVAPFAS